MRSKNLKNLTRTMNKVKSLFLSSLLCCGFAYAQVKPAIPYNAEIEQKVAKTLAKMTLDEKIGQMCELTADVVTNWEDKDGWSLNPQALDNVFELDEFFLCDHSRYLRH